MLLIIKNIRELNRRDLLCVYEEYIQQRARRKFRHLDENLAILEAEQELYAFYTDFLRQRDNLVAVWCDNGRYISALRIENYRDGVLVTAVETLPVCRKKGYAGCLMKETVRYLQELGIYKIYSHIRCDNTPSVQLHLQCGFQKISDSAVLLDGSADCKTGTYLCCV